MPTFPAAPIGLSQQSLNTLAERDDILLDTIANQAAWARPGDAPEVYGIGTTTQTDVSSTWLFSDTFGRVVRLQGHSVSLAPRRLAPIESNRIYLARFVVQRRTNTTDPANDAVVLGIAYFDASKNYLSELVFETISTLTVASSRQSRNFVYSSSAGSIVNVVAPTSARYARPFVRVFGTLPRTDVEVLGAADITDSDFARISLAEYESRFASAEDSLNALIESYDNGTQVVGDWSAASGAFPTTRPDATPVEVGDTWIVSTAGTVGGVSFEVPDRLIALRAGGGVSYATNWIIAKYSDILSAPLTQSLGGTGAISAAATLITPTGASQTRTLGDRLSGIGFEARDFGAFTPDSTDDVTTLNDLFTAAADAGVPAYIRDTHRVAGTVLMRDGLTAEWAQGAWLRTTILGRGPLTTLYDLPGGGIAGRTPNGVRLLYPQLDGALANFDVFNQSVNAIGIARGSSHIHIHGLRVRNFPFSQGGGGLGGKAFGAEFGANNIRVTGGIHAENCGYAFYIGADTEEYDDPGDGLGKIPKTSTDVFCDYVYGERCDCLVGVFGYDTAAQPTPATDGAVQSVRVLHAEGRNVGHTYRRITTSAQREKGTVFALAEVRGFRLGSYDVHNDAAWLAALTYPAVTGNVNGESVVQGLSGPIGSLVEGHGTLNMGPGRFVSACDDLVRIKRVFALGDDAGPSTRPLATAVDIDTISYLGAAGYIVAGDPDASNNAISAQVSGIIRVKLLPGATLTGLVRLSAATWDNLYLDVEDVATGLRVFGSCQELFAAGNTVATAGLVERHPGLNARAWTLDASVTAVTSEETYAQRMSGHTALRFGADAGATNKDAICKQRVKVAQSCPISISVETLFVSVVGDTLSLIVNWYDIAGAFISNTSASLPDVTAGGAAATETRVFVPPATAFSAAIQFRRMGTSAVGAIYVGALRVSRSDELTWTGGVGAEVIARTASATLAIGATSTGANLRDPNGGAFSPALSGTWAAHGPASSTLVARFVRIT